MARFVMKQENNNDGELREQTPQAQTAETKPVEEEERHKRPHPSSLLVCNKSFPAPTLLDLPGTIHIPLPRSQYLNPQRPVMQMSALNHY